MTSKGKFDDFARADEELKLPPRTKIYVHVVEGPDLGRRFDFIKGNAVIGRRRNALSPGEFAERDPDFSLLDSEVSPWHALIEAYAQEKIFIKDLDSTSGVFINGERLTSFGQILPGDKIRLGRTLLQLYVERL